MPSKIKKPKKTTPPPQTEVDLQNLQKKFLENREDEKIREEFFFLLRNYARSIALKKIKGSTFLPPERIDEICTDATLSLLKNYDKYPNYKVDFSFGGMLYWNVNGAMYGQANDEQNSSLNSVFDESDSSSKEVMDIVSYNSNLPWNASFEDLNKGSLPEDEFFKEVDVSFNEVKEVIDEAYKILPYNLYLRFLCYLVLFFRKPKTRNINLLFSNLFIDNKEENVFEILMLEIHKHIEKHT